MPSITPSISVVLATCNGQAYLEKQLASLASQSLTPFELVVSDDASTDRTNEIVERFSQTAPFPVVHRKNATGLGFRENFIAAARLAKGDWIAFCDQDDVWRQDKLATCAEYFSTPGVTQIAHQATLIDGDDQEMGMFRQGITQTGLKKQLAYDIWGTFWGFSMLVDRRLLFLVDPHERFVDYIDSRHLIAHDRWAFFLAQTLGNTMEIAEPLAGYRQHGKNLFGNGESRRKQKSAAALKTENAAYVSATRRMLQIVESLPSRCEQDFPAFDRQAAIRTYSRALNQLVKRGAIYDSGRASAVLKGLAMLARGDYRNAQDGSLRWRSFLRDMSVSVERR